MTLRNVLYIPLYEISFRQPGKISSRFANPTSFRRLKDILSLPIGFWSWTKIGVQKSHEKFLKTSIAESMFSKFSHFFFFKIYFSSTFTTYYTTKFIQQSKHFPWSVIKDQWRFRKGTIVFAGHFILIQKHPFKMFYEIDVRKIS